MRYKDFISNAIKQDIRNTFTKLDTMPNIIPPSLHDFYKECNPKDVEINTEKYGNIRFYGVDKLEGLRNEFYFYPKDVFIFATCNGDPFFIGEDSKIYTSLESRYSPEKVSDSFKDFLDSCF